MQQAALSSAHQTQQDNFARETSEITLRIEQQLADYEQALRGVNGLYIASKSVEDEFPDYVAILRIEKRYPGIQGIGFSKIIPKQGKARHIEAICKEIFPSHVHVSAYKPNIDAGYIGGITVEAIAQAGTLWLGDIACYCAPSSKYGSGTNASR